MQGYVIHGYVHKYRHITILTEKYYVYNTESQNSINYIRKISLITQPARGHKY